MTAMVAAMMASGGLKIDPRNRDIQIYVNGQMVHRDRAVVSVYDAGFMLGDGVWEGVRLHKGVLLFVEDHLDRLFAGAKMIGIDIPWTRLELIDALRLTVDTNQMTHGVHCRLMLTRGRKITTDQDPRLCPDGPTLVIIAEHKDEIPEDQLRNLNLTSVHIHRGAPDTQDPRLNSHSKLNCILAMLSAMHAGADEALMMDPLGFVSTCNSVNFFIVREGEIWTSTGDYCMNGITRRKTIEICRAAGLIVREKNFSLVDVYSAGEAFVTGTTGGQTPVRSVDGRVIGEGLPGPMLRKVRGLYKALVGDYCAARG